MVIDASIDSRSIQDWSTLICKKKYTKNEQH